MKLKQKKYKAVIIGAGKIAAGFDSPASRHVLTHAHALIKHPRVSLAGMMDINSIEGSKAARKWNTAFYDDLDRMLSETDPDIAVIATPDASHLKLLKDLMVKNIPVIICEKPVVAQQSDIAILDQLIKKSKSDVIVNFRRRFDPTIISLRNDLMQGKYGAVLSANAIYSKGILHNGIHIIDLARYLFGEVLSAKMMFAVDDFPSGTPSLGGVATFEGCPQFYLMNADERKYSVAEFEIFTAKKRFLFSREGFILTTEEVIDDPVFKGDRTLGKLKTKETGLINSMSALVDNAVSVLDGKASSRSTLSDALITHKTCFKLLSKFSKK